MESGPLKFFLDEQLGKLARWLRILGQDASYRKQIEDDELIAAARDEGRTILTRDTRLPERAEDVKVDVLEQNYPALQLREVVEKYRDRMKIRLLTRCPVCNVPVRPVGKAEVEDRVPPFVYKTQENFTECPECKRVYWKATHRDRIELQLRDILGPLYEELKERE